MILVDSHVQNSRTDNYSILDIFTDVSCNSYLSYSDAMIRQSISIPKKAVKTTLVLSVIDKDHADLFKRFNSAFKQYNGGHLDIVVSSAVDSDFIKKLHSDILKENSFRVKLICVSEQVDVTTSLMTALSSSQSIIEKYTALSDINKHTWLALMHAYFNDRNVAGYDVGEYVKANSLLIKGTTPEIDLWNCFQAMIRLYQYPQTFDILGDTPIGKSILNDLIIPF